MMKSILTTIAFLALAVSGLAQTRSVIVNTSGVVQSPTNFWSADVTNARSGLGLGTAATNPASAFQPSSLALSNLASSNGGALTNLTAANITGIVSISNGGSSATTVGGARTNLGLGTTNLVQFAGVVSPNLYSSSLNALIELDDNAFILTADTAEFRQPISFDNTTNAATTRTNLGGTTVGNSVFTATNAAAAADAIGLGATNQVGFDSVQANDFTVSDGGTISFEDTGSIEFGNAAGPTRTNLGLGWSALTNSNAGTGLVSVSTNGEVVSPTNFWQVAPISTTVQYQTNVTGTSTNAATNSRNLFLFSLAPSVSGLTNTVTLPTNTATTFEGDRATIIHLATNSANTVTAIRQLGAATNLITLNQVDEAVLLMYRSGVWVLSDNVSYVEPIFFSGTNATANAAASRTNLGLGITNLVQFAYVESPYFFVGDGTNGIDFETDAVAAITRTNLGIGSGATNTVSFGKIRVPTGNFTIEDPVNDASIITFPTDTDPVVLGADYWNHAAVRTSLGLGSGITTNLVLKNGSNQDTYMNFSNGILIYGSTVAP